MLCSVWIVSLGLLAAAQAAPEAASAPVEEPPVQLDTIIVTPQGDIWSRSDRRLRKIIDGLPGGGYDAKRDSRWREVGSKLAPMMVPMVRPDDAAGAAAYDWHNERMHLDNVGDGRH